jgi:hypothetical protein
LLCAVSGPDSMNRTMPLCSISRLPALSIVAIMPGGEDDMPIIGASDDR